MKQSIQPTSSNKTNHYLIKIIGIILIILGIILPFISFSFHLKLSATLLLIGFVIILILNEKETDRIINQAQINNMQLLIIIILVPLFILLITLQVDFEIFIILTIISILALKEFLNSFLSQHLQKRMTILFFILLIPVMVILVQRIINILNMYPS